MPRQPEPPEPEYKEVGRFKVTPHTDLDPENRDEREIYVTKEILRRRRFLPDKLGPPIYRDSSGATFRPNGEKDQYAREGTGKVYKRIR